MTGQKWNRACARALAEQSGIAMLARVDLSAERLCQVLGAVTAAPKRTIVAKGFDGAERTVSLTRDMMGQR